MQAGQDLLGEEAHRALGKVGRHRKHEVKGGIEVATSGSNIRVRVAAPGDVSGGDDVSNIVSRLTAGGANGVQIEQGPRARDEFSAAIAAAVADVYRPRL